MHLGLKCYSQKFVLCPLHILNFSLILTGDVSETIRKYFELSRTVRPKDESKVTMYDVDEFLDKLTRVTREDDQIDCFQKFCQTCNSEDLKTVCVNGF